MVTVLDTDQLPPADRAPARVAARLEATLVSRIQFADSRLPARARLDAWDLGGLPALRAELSGELSLTRSVREAREDPVPTVAVVLQERGSALHAQFDRRRVVPSGGLALTELASPYEYRCSALGVCRALQVPVSRLGLPVDVVRRAIPRVQHSPLYGLVRTHLEGVIREAEVLAGEPMVASIAGATIDLTRALLASAGGTARALDDAVSETLLAQVRAYIRQHLTEPRLGVEQIAVAHAISVRHLYRLCSAAEFSLEQSIIHQRLEGARHELSDPVSRDRSIAMVARRWGFTDPSYFSRRFRRTFGLTPSDWRQVDARAIPPGRTVNK